MSNNPSGTVLRSASDDLESLFYIFVEFICTFSTPGTPPDPSRNLLPWHEHSAIESWALITFSKRGFLYSLDDDNSLVESHVRSYFSSLAPVALKWRLLFKSRDTVQNFQFTHEKVKAILDHALKDIELLPLALPSYSSTSTHPSLPTASGTRTESLDPTTSRRRNPKRQRHPTASGRLGGQ